jgi:hypothetical protein
MQTFRNLNLLLPIRIIRLFKRVDARPLVSLWLEQQTEKMLCVVKTLRRVLVASRLHGLRVDSTQNVAHGSGKLKCCNSTANRNERNKHGSKRMKVGQSLRLMKTASSRKLGVIVAEPSFPSKLCKQPLFAFEWDGGSGSRRRNSHEEVQDRRVGKDSGWLCRSAC